MIWKVIHYGACMSAEDKKCMPLETGRVGENTAKSFIDCNGVIVV